MAAKVRVMHYINQFFAGMGGEDKADVPLGSLEGSAGPGKRLQQLLGDAAEIVVTIYCGDDYFNKHHDKVLPSILKIAQDHKVEAVVAGPAFNAGRYGFACVEVCHFMNTSTDLSCVTGMSIDNPGLAGYKQYKDKKVFCLPTAGEVIGMENALSRMAKFALKLAAGSVTDSAADEGYIGRGIRPIEPMNKISAERAIDMWLAKVAGRPFTTEIPVEGFEEIPVPPRIENLKNTHLALISVTGVHAEGNPHGFKGIQNTKWVKYPIDKLNSMTDINWEVIHGGYNNAFMKQNPNFGIPLDVSRVMEREGVFAKLHPAFYATTGVLATVTAMKTIGEGIVADMKKEGVDATILVSTWGTCTRSGAVIVKEIERGGVPVIHLTAMTAITKNVGAHRIVAGVKLPHPCGDPNLPPDTDRALRREIVQTALDALQTDVSEPTIFVPKGVVAA